MVIKKEKKIVLLNFIVVLIKTFKFIIESIYKNLTQNYWNRTIHILMKSCYCSFNFNISTEYHSKDLYYHRYFINIFIDIFVPWTLTLWTWTFLVFLSRICYFFPPLSSQFHSIESKCQDRSPRQHPIFLFFPPSKVICILVIFFLLNY